MKVIADHSLPFLNSLQTCALQVTTQVKSDNANSDATEKEKSSVVRPSILLRVLGETDNLRLSNVFALQL